MVHSEMKYNPSTNSYSVTKVGGEYKTIGPLNVGFQITRRCNLKCTYCSEIPNHKEMSLSQIEHSLKNLKNAGVLKVNLTGGEALLRKDLIDIVDMSKDMGFHVAVDSNAVLVNEKIAESLTGKLAYFESTIDGYPTKHNLIRGNYAQVFDGIKLMAETGTPIYIASVLVDSTLKDVEHVLFTGHMLGAKGVKYLTPIPKARGKIIPEEYRNSDRYKDLWDELLKYKEKFGLTPAVSMADWQKIGKGSVILINSDGEVVGSPSIGDPDCVTKMGNILEESIEEMWKRYQYKDNHINKYLGITMPIKK